MIVEAAAIFTFALCPANPVVLPGYPTVVGDSVTVAAAQSLHRLGLGVNARGCRQMAEGLSVMHRRRRSHVVLALGANGTLTTQDLRVAYRFTDHLTLVTPGGPGDGDRGRMLTFASWHRDVKVVDWYKLSHSEGGLLAPDNLHLTTKGARVYAAAIARKVKS